MAWQWNVSAHAGAAPRRASSASAARGVLRDEWHHGNPDPQRRREILDQALAHVQRQLGHSDIGTTIRNYGHLEQSFLHDAAARAETAIFGAATVAAD